jgi:murein DD-endopeptidase MepM/ murein hydrolase activator NlpD
VDDLKVRITWVNDTASLTAAVAQARQALEAVSGGNAIAAGVATPSQVAAAGLTRAPDPVYNTGGGGNGGGGDSGGQSWNATATSGTGTSNAATAGAVPPKTGAAGRSSSHISGILGYFGRSIMVREAFGALSSIGEAAQQNQALSDLNRRAGDGVQKWRDFKEEILSVGIGLGATNQQMIEVSNQFATLTGRMDRGKMTSALRNTFETAKTLGISPESVAGYEGRMAQFGQGPATDFNRLTAALALGVKQGMELREEELMKSIETLTGVVASRLPSLSEQQMMTVQGFIGALNATGVQGFMGARGAQVAGTVNEYLSGKGNPAQQALLFRGLAAQQPKSSLLDLLYQIEGGAGDIKNISAFRTQFAGMTKGKGADEAGQIMAGMTGLSLNQGRELAKNLPNMTDEAIMKFINAKGGTTPDKTQSDKDTEAMKALERAMTTLGDGLIPLVTKMDTELAAATVFLAKILGTLAGPLAIVGTVLPAIAVALGVNSMANNPMGKHLGSGLSGALKGGIALGVGALAVDAVSETLQTLPWISKLLDRTHGNVADALGLLGEGGNGPLSEKYNNKKSTKGTGQISTGQASAARGTSIFDYAVTQDFGVMNETYGRHTGVDLGLPENTSIAALAAGMVTRTRSERMGGNIMEVKYDSGYSQLLAHLNGYLLRTGDRFNEGDALALSGKTGSAVHGAHLHTEMRDPSGNLVDPTMYPHGGPSSSTVNHSLTVTVRQPDGSTDTHKIDLTSPYRNSVTSPDWGVSGLS